MNFLNSAYIHGIVYIHEGATNPVIEAWGDRPITIVTPERSQEFQQELIGSDLETLKEKYTKDHLIVLTDAAWVDYDPVFSRTLFVCTQPKLLVMASSLNDCDLLPLLNLVRANDRLPMLFDHAQIEVALRGHVFWNREETRKYAEPLFNPFEPYPIYLKEPTDFTKLLYPVRSLWDTLTSFFDFNGSMLFACGSDSKKKEVTRFFRCNGFTPLQDAGLKRNNTTVYITCQTESTVHQVQQLHVVDPPENLARTLAKAKSRSLTVHLYVPYSNPFEEPLELKSYRMSLGRNLRQREWMNPPPLTLFAILSGFFVHNPLWTRAAIVAMAQQFAPGLPRDAIIEELDFMVQSRLIVVDAFEREGYLVFSENMYIYQPFVTVQE
jgi:hypothetical protein